MAEGGRALSGKLLYIPTNGMSLIIMEGSIVETDAEAVATGENSSLDGSGAVTSLLLKHCPPTYKRARDNLKGSCRKFEHGKVYPCQLPNPATAMSQRKGVGFSVVLHAIVPPTHKGQVKEWAEQIRRLYHGIFEAANRQGKASLALPLLGSGKAGASMDTAVEVFSSAIVTFKMANSRGVTRHLHTVTLYVIKKEAFRKMVQKMEEKLRTLPPLNGVVPPLPVSTRNGVRGTQPKPSSSKSRGGRQAPGVGRRGRSGRKPAGQEAAASAAEVPQDNMVLILQGLTLADVSSPPGQQVGEEEKDFFDSSSISGGEEEEEEELSEEHGGPEEGGEEEEEEEMCAICLDVMDNPKKLEKCGHTFCTDCIDDSFKHHKPVCPSCNTVYGVIRGNQPRGSMTSRLSSQSLPGYEYCGQIVIDYEFPSGIQGPEHPNPGQLYQSTARRAFLPDCTEGRKVYRLLRVAFDSRLVFTVGRSVTTGFDNVVTWNDIHHKTRPFGGPTAFGYPDPEYLSRVQEELAAKGVTEECLRGRSFDL